MRRWLIGVALVCMSAAVTACPLCIGGGARSPAEDLADLSRAVLAIPIADGTSYRVFDAVPDYVALMKSGVRQQYASRAAIVAYLRQSPGGVAGIGNK